MLKTILRVLAILTILLSFSLLPSKPVQAATGNPFPHDLGVTVAWQLGVPTENTIVSLLHNPSNFARPYFYNWVANHMSDIYYYPMAFSMKTANQDNYIGAGKVSKGKSWLLGNEPELPDSAATPAEAAIFSKRWRNEVGTYYACCGVQWSQFSTGDDAWLNAFVAAGGPTAIPDYWHIHIYWVCTGAEWDAQINLFKAWMAAHNAVRPIIVSETNAGYYCNNLSTQQALMLHINQEINANHVYAAFWYTSYDSGTFWNYANLVKKDAAGNWSVLPLGQTFISTY